MTFSLRCVQGMLQTTLLLIVLQIIVPLGSNTVSTYILKYLFHKKASKIYFQDQFQGKIIHSAEWPSKTDVKGKKVAIIGTGASAVQVQVRPNTS